MLGSGNMLVDLHENSDLHISVCHNCEGSGRIDWDEIGGIANELGLLAWRRKKQGNPITTFEELLRVAHLIKEEGRKCPRCDGLGEV